MEQEETQAIAKCQTGEREAFAWLYDKYIRRIYDFIYYKTLHKEIAEDITSQTFLKALEKIGTYDRNKGSFSGWLYAIARHNIIDYFRGRKPEQNIEDVWDLEADDDIVRDLDIKIKLEKMRQCLAKLNSDQRHIIIMRLWQGASHGEIAQALGKSEASCKMAYCRALTRLREQSVGAFVIN